jgi:hypothetical protein
MSRRARTYRSELNKRRRPLREDIPPAETRALILIAAYRAQHIEGPTWIEIREALGFERRWDEHGCTPITDE